MVARQIKLKPGLLCFLAALLVSGCASSSDFTVPMPDLSLAVPGNSPSDVASAETIAYGEPPVVPAEFSGGPQAVADADGPYLLDTGDRLRVFVYGQPNLSRGYTVDHEGAITVPLIGTVQARGLTTRDLEAAITSRLGSQFVRDPQVTVDIQQNRPFFIHGEVKTSGQYPYVSGMTVETAVAIAGGLSERGSARRFRISRRTNGFVEQIIAPADYVIKPGDTVFVYERFF
jgi:polysaccharide export outer membrane protein